ncbi:putative leucine-rich repeat-containing protein DDB_G0290503 isoform X2 [Dendropsophus ebraccatus]|uniref:putative leucine-rich repeat-containing protein DDB_G0290503 isoform X2 n=1 Tax=Dendropsophus ebraccatus TaxID=150705 RepID=UPI0038312C16
MSYRGSKVTVGVTSRSSEEDMKWLMEFIRETFWEIVSDVRYLPITNRNSLDWEDNVRRCSVGILYHTKRQGRLNIVDIEGALYDEELQSLSRILGKSKVLVVLDDLEKCSDSERQRILDAQRSLRQRASQLLLFPEKAKSEEAYKNLEEFRKVFGYNTPARDLQANTNGSRGTTQMKSDVSAGRKAYNNLKSLFPTSKHPSEQNTRTSPDYTQYKQPKKLESLFSQPFDSSLKISIFSRSAQSNYRWLVDWLKTTYRRKPVDVHEVYITNNYTDFYSELQSCSFAILYHTIKQGRLNITDVTDSLYNQELEDLSIRPGKENVIVVVDDLPDTSSAEKDRILRNQPSIGRLAKDLFLFSDKRKNTESLETLKGIISRKTPDRHITEAKYAPEPYERKSNKSNSSASRLEQQDHLDRVDHLPSPSGSSLTARCEGGNMSSVGDLIWDHDDDSGEPEVKKIALDLTTLDLHSPKAMAEMSNTFKDTSLKLQDVLRIIQEDQAKMLQEIQRLQRENEELQRSKKKLLEDRTDNKIAYRKILEANNKTIQEKQFTIEKLQEDLQDKDRTMEEKKQTMVRTIQDLQKKLREKEGEIQDQQQTIKDLQDKDRMMEEKNQTMVRTIQDLQKKLREKEGEIQDQRQTIKDLQDKDRMMVQEIQTMVTIHDLQEKLREKESEIQALKNQQQNIEDLQHKDRTMEEKNQTMVKTIQDLQEKLREKEGEIQDQQQTIEDLQDKDRTSNQEIQQLQEHIQKMQSSPKREHVGLNREQGFQPQEFHRTKQRSPIPGKEDDGSTQGEHGGYNCDLQKGFTMDEGSLSPKAHSYTGAMYNKRQNPTERPGLTPQNDLVEQLKCTVQQKDEEIQNLRITIEKQKLQLDDNASLIDDLLSGRKDGKEKAKC